MVIDEYFEKINGEYRQKFEKLRKILLEGNDKFNLTAILDEKAVYIRHFLDSVVGEKYMPQNSSVVEIGSGGGFPSLPLKIIRDDLKFLLVESTGKKCVYLENAVYNLGLKDVRVLNARAEEAARQVMHREMYDIAEARAVARLNTLCEYCIPFVRIGGRFIAYKGDCEEELEEAKKAIEVLGGEIEQVERYLLPDGEKRTLIVIKKVTSTPLKYPRGQGKERKAPIK